MPSNEPNPWRLAGLGLELAGGTVVFGGIGWWIDQQTGWTPWGLVTGAVIGAVGGMYLLIKEAIKANR